MSAHSATAVHRWPVILLALPAAVAVWSGWVGLGKLSGFGLVQPLPGITTWHLNTAITLPVGVEAYGGYALGAWLNLAAGHPARNFARASALGSLALGVLGQVSYHLLAAAHATRAPALVVVLVACMPVVVLGFGAALTHLLRLTPPEAIADPTGELAGLAADIAGAVAALAAEIRVPLAVPASTALPSVVPVAVLGTAPVPPESGTAASVPEATGTRGRTSGTGTGNRSRGTGPARGGITQLGSVRSDYMDRGREAEKRAGRRLTAAEMTAELHCSKTVACRVLRELHPKADAADEPEPEGAAL